jgi:hypothetical protein
MSEQTEELRKRLLESLNKPPLEISGLPKNYVEELTERHGPPKWHLEAGVGSVTIYSDGTRIDTRPEKNEIYKPR